MLKLMLLVAAVSVGVVLAYPSVTSAHDDPVVPLQPARAAKSQPDASEDYILEDAIAPVSKRQIRLKYIRRSQFNELIARLHSMRGDRYHYDRVAPMRFGGGRR